MDFRLFFAVLQRFKWIVLLGFILACSFAFLSFVRVGPHGIQYREQEQWMSTARVLVTSSSQDPTQLAMTYSALATSDDVVKAAVRKHKIAGLLQADFGYVNRTSTALPTVSLAAMSTTPARSATLANDAVRALQEFVANQQAESGLPVEKRARLQPLNVASPGEAVVSVPRSKTPPVVVFILMMAATIGLVFVLENLRPRVRMVPAESAQKRASSADARRISQQA
jgi:capsular polysaccharide biosynthesis protein